jgi:4-hydroxy-tetrahydrodipicolinate synthase
MGEKKPISGVVPVINTPFDGDDRIDHAVLAREIDWAFEQGADGICAGMVSEWLRLTHDERVELSRSMVELAAGRGVVITSVGAESTEHALLMAREAAQAGCDGMMAIPPLSTALSSAETATYFAAIADEVELPLIVQDSSAYVGQPIEIDVLGQLLDRYGPDKILFKPEAAPLGPNISALRDRTDGKAPILEGSGGISLVDSFRRGIVGTMPGVDLLDQVIALWRALEAGDEGETYRRYLPLCAVVTLMSQAGLDGFLAIEKYILVKRGIFENVRRRAPIAWELDDETAREIDRLLALAGITTGG